MSERQLTRDTIGQLLDQCRPTWRLRAATLADSGYLSVYHLDVETPDGTREVVLKANPFDDPHGVGLEARILGRLSTDTDIPVPAVLGVLDSDPDLPTPAFLMAAVPGRVRERQELADIDPRTLGSIARNLGRYLGELHRLDVVDDYGYVTTAEPPTYHGERLDGSRGAIEVADPSGSWPETLEGWGELALDGLEGTRFADLESDIRTALADRIDGLTGPFEPALSHIDGSIENVVTTSDGEITAVLDWAFTLAAPPVYDLVLVEHSLAGGHWRYLPDTPDLLPAVRESLQAGYAETGTDRVIEQFHADRETYQLVALAHSLCHADDWFDDQDVPDVARRAATRNHRSAIADLL